MKHQGMRSARAARLLAAALAGVVVALLAASPAGAVSRPFFGLAVSNHTEALDFRMMGDARVGTYRFQLDWANIQPTEGGPYDWSSVDPQVEGAALNGIELLPILYGAPSYASGDHREPPLGSNEDKQGWQDFVTAAVERYSAGGEFWQTFEVQHPGVEPQPVEALQVWNEQNSPTYWEPKPSPRKYAELLRISHEAITGVDPGVDVVLGGMFGTPSRDRGIFSWKFLKRLYKVNGAERHFDAVALHPYSPNLAGIRAQIELAREKITRRTPIWITEIGWGSAGTRGQPLNKSPNGQRKMLKKSFNLLLKRRGKWNIKRVMWFTWTDQADGSDPVGVVCGWCGSAGLLESDRTPKPSFNAFRSFTGR